MSVFDQRLLLSFPFPLTPDLLIDKGIDPKLLSQLIDPSILSKLPHVQQAMGGGKINNSASSFRISDLLESPRKDINAASSSQHCLYSGSTPEDQPSPLRGETPPHGGSPSEDGCSTLGKKARKARTIFTDKQLQELENTFEKQKYLSVQDRMELAQRMGLSDTQVKTWYQNRRTKWKRQASVEIDHLNDDLLRSTPYWSQYLQHQALIGQLGQGFLGSLAQMGFLTNMNRPNTNLFSRNTFGLQKEIGQTTIESSESPSNGTEDE